MAVGRYVVVDADHDNKDILAGPLLWNPDGDEYDPGDNCELMLESAALADGWVYVPSDI